MFKKFTSKLPAFPAGISSSESGDNQEKIEDHGQAEGKSSDGLRSSLPSQEAMSAAATAAASSMMGFMKKAQSTASTMVKEGSARAITLKNKAVDAADMDSLQRKLEAALENDTREDVDAASLNFTYINERIVAMGFPGSNPMAVRYNPIGSVASILNKDHGGRYMIWNLSEEPYDYSKFNDQVLEFKFPGHPAPPLGLLFKICTSIESWLEADPSNLAVIHCLTGKGRTGSVIACYLAWCGEFENPIKALEFVSKKRNIPIEKLTIPSQRRYVQYFSSMMDGVKPRSDPLLLRRVIINTIPIFATRKMTERKTSSDNGDKIDNSMQIIEEVESETKGCCPYLQIFKGGKLIFTTTWKDAESGTGVKWASEDEGSISFPVDCMLQGDVLVRCRHLSDSGQRISMFRAAFHTGYIPLGVLRLSKAQLDGACQDQRFSEDFFIDFIFAPISSDEGLAKGETEAPQTEGISISGEDKQAYEIMLHRDEKFWADIAARKERLRSERNQKRSDNPSRSNTNTFSIASGEDDIVPKISKDTNKEVWIEKASRTKEQNTQEDEFLAQLESITSGSGPLNHEKQQAVDHLASLPSSNNGNSEPKEVTDKDFKALSKLEEELGLESFSTELKNLPGPPDTTSSIPAPDQSISTDTSFNFLDDDLADITGDASGMDLGSSNFADSANLDLDDNFDDLEEYLNNLSTTTSDKSS